MTETKHTPTPWYTTGLNPRRNIIQSVPLDSDNYICECDNDTDAAFIVRAVNSHNALVEAAQKLSETLHLQYEELSNAAIAHVPELAKLDATLAQAKGDA